MIPPITEIKLYGPDAKRPSSATIDFHVGESPVRISRILPYGTSGLGLKEMQIQLLRTLARELRSCADEIEPNPYQ